MDLLSICLWICIIILIVVIVYVVCSPSYKERFELSDIDDDLITCIMNISFPKDTLLLTTSNNSPAYTNKWMNANDWTEISEGLVLASGVNEDSITSSHIVYIPDVSYIVNNNYIHGLVTDTSIMPIQSMLLMQVNNLWVIAVIYYYFSDSSVSNEYDLTNLFSEDATFTVASYSRSINKALRNLPEDIYLEGYNKIKINNGILTLESGTDNELNSNSSSSSDERTNALRTSFAYGVFYGENIIDVKSNTGIHSGDAIPLNTSSYEWYVDKFCPPYYYDFTSYVTNNSDPVRVRRLWFIPSGNIYKVILKASYDDYNSETWELDGISLTDTTCLNDERFSSTTSSISYNNSSSSDSSTENYITYQETVLLFEWNDIDFSSYSSDRRTLRIYADTSNTSNTSNVLNTANVSNSSNVLNTSTTSNALNAYTSNMLNTSNTNTSNTLNTNTSNKLNTSNTSNTLNAYTSNTLNASNMINTSNTMNMLNASNTNTSNTNTSNASDTLNASNTSTKSNTNSSNTQIESTSSTSTGGTVLTVDNIPYHTHNAYTYADTSSTHEHEISTKKIYKRCLSANSGTKTTRFWYNYSSSSIYEDDEIQQTGTETDSHNHTVSYNPLNYGNPIPYPHYHGFDNSQIPKFYVKAWKRTTCSECVTKSSVVIDTNKTFIKYVLDLLFPRGSIIITTNTLSSTFKSFFNDAWVQLNATYIPISGIYSGIVEQQNADAHIKYTNGYALQYFNLPIHTHKLISTQTDSSDFTHSHDYISYPNISKPSSDGDTYHDGTAYNATEYINVTDGHFNAPTITKEYNGNHTHDVEVSAYGKSSPTPHYHTLNMNYLNVYIYIRTKK